MSSSQAGEEKQSTHKNLQKELAAENPLQQKQQAPPPPSVAAAPSSTTSNDPDAEVGIDDGDDDESDASVESGISILNVRNPKRSHDQVSGSDEDGGAPTRKKPSLGTAKGTILTQSQLTDSGLPTPDVTAEEGKEADADVEDEDEAEDDGWSDFEGDLEKEMERVAHEGELALESAAQAADV